MDLSVDTSLFLADFAETALFGGAEIRGIFDNGYAAALDVAGTLPTFTCASADAAALTPGASTLVIRSASWLVTGVEDDGTGMAVLRLQRN